MLKIAITGNIASGKSLFEKYLVEAGYKVLCLDEVTHFLYKNSDELKIFLKEKFNTDERALVASIVFEDTKLKKELEDFIFPLILDKMNNFFIQNQSEKFLFVSAAILFEAGFDKYFDKVVFISADIKTRLQRLQKRNNLSYKDALLRISSQDDENSKIAKSDFAIDNSGTKEELKEKAKTFIKSLNTLL